MRHKGTFLLLAFFLSQSVSAAVITSYTDGAAWEAGVGSFAVESFGTEETASAEALMFPDSGVGSTYVQNLGPYEGDLHRLAAFSECTSGSCFGTVVSGTSVNLGVAVWGLGGPVDAFGVDLAGVTSGLEVLLFRGGFGGDLVSAVDIDALLPERMGFYGLVSTRPFDTIVWTTEGAVESFSADDLRFRRLQLIPEPAHLGLLALALWLVGPHRPRREP